MRFSTGSLGIAMSTSWNSAKVLLHYSASVAALCITAFPALFCALALSDYFSISKLSQISAIELRNLLVMLGAVLGFIGLILAIFGTGKVISVLLASGIFSYTYIIVSATNSRGFSAPQSALECLQGIVVFFPVAVGIYHIYRSVNAEIQLANT